ncbi:MAG: lipoyl(octanoyl) transferase LipB [Tannerellaceae bacterium]|jgi:lipoyl(octanoyl) transferase|nr:lipoyl(octanoyl) transferase LipB [Tannerellaceae bacterium]
MSGFVFEDCGRIRYGDALARQTAAFEGILAAKLAGGDAPNRVFFCEHEPVITLGRRANEANVLVSADCLAERGVELFRTDRGGDATYHGPGQLTVYPVVDLEGLGMGLRTYVCWLEGIVIDFLRAYGIECYRLEGATGVWTGDEPRKICAIGVRSSRFVVMHGFALNVNTSLDAFRLINPCGFTDRGVTSMAEVLGCELGFEETKAGLRRALECGLV